MKRENRSFFQFYSIGPHHIPYDDRLTPDKECHQCKSGHEPSFIRTPNGIHHSPEVFSMKHSINCEHKDNEQESSIKDHSFIFFISSSPFCRFQNLFLDPAAKSFVNFVQSCVSANTETQFCKKDSSCHVHQNMLFRQ